MSRQDSEKEFALVPDIDLFKNPLIRAIFDLDLSDAKKASKIITFLTEPSNQIELEDLRKIAIKFSFKHMSSIATIWLKERPVNNFSKEFLQDICEKCKELPDAADRDGNLAQIINTWLSKSDVNNFDQEELLAMLDNIEGSEYKFEIFEEWLGKTKNYCDIHYVKRIFCKLNTTIEKNFKNLVSSANAWIQSVTKEVESEDEEEEAANDDQTFCETRSSFLEIIKAKIFPQELLERAIKELLKDSTIDEESLSKLKTEILSAARTEESEQEVPSDKKDRDKRTREEDPPSANPQDPNASRNTRSKTR